MQETFLYFIVALCFAVEGKCNQTLVLFDQLELSHHLE